jgi:hypothetical protein
MLRFSGHLAGDCLSYAEIFREIDKFRSVPMIDVKNNLKTVRVGLLLALLSILFGYSLGIAFGAAEESLKESLRASGVSVFATVYHQDAAALDKAVRMAWGYYHKAHLHAGALGASAVAQILLVALLPTAARLKSGVAFLLGAGALGYAVYWLLAARRIPLVGDSHIASESLDWLAMPAAGACIFGTLFTLALTVKALFFRPVSA